MLKSFKTQLTIFQQEGYSPSRFFHWWLPHPLTYSISSKKPLVMTSKAKRLTGLSRFIFLFIFLILIFDHLFLFSLFLVITYIFQPFIFIFFSLLLILPQEKINRNRTLNRIRRSILSKKHLTVIGITGSYGKTSVKDFLYTIVSGYKPTVKTPASYNTVFGIAKVVDLELLTKTKFFLCEMGAYVRGEIAELCYMVPPQYGILTAIGSQHLERFKSIDNTTLAKFELIDAIKPEKGLVNLDNEYISKKIQDPQYRLLNTYSLKDSQADFYIKKYSLSPDGMKFTLIHNGNSFHYSSSLFGTSNLYNLTAAISMSLILKIPQKIITERVSLIRPSAHRLELKRIGKATLIDNAFSSNEEGFSAIVSDLAHLKGKKVIITPGIIELGQKTTSVHRQLGQLASSVFDKFILVGHSERTDNFEKGLGIKNKNKISYIDNSTNLWPIIDDLSKDFDWILLENDLPDTA